MKLSGITWDHPRGYDPVVAASEAYAEQTGVEISWQKRSLQAFADAPIAELAEAHDFIVLDHPHVGQIAETGALLPLPAPEDDGASLGGSAESYLWQGQCWAYAIDAACQMACHRPDLGAPVAKVWEDFLRPEAKAFRPLTPLLPVDAFDMFMTLVAGRGGAVMPYAPQRFVSEENGLHALTVLRALFALGPSDQVKMNPIHVLETLSSEGGDFAASPCLFGYVNYARQGFRAHPVAYVDLPVWQGYKGSKAILGGAGIGVSAQTIAPREAIAFAQWLATEAVQSGIYLAGNGQPAHRRTWLAQQAQGDATGFFKGGFATIDSAWTRPRAPWFLGFVDDVCEIMPDFFLKAIPCETFLAQLDALYRHHLKGA
ncbi:extracellular solute-binding protein [Pseudoruegeria sp. SHC-113]|uniref:extracellular solute-binding protein n=1 Tax=Pseudoruegeria sp. SHC-113 TaxID=2855439 RepID=UPI0021BB8667|nr:extracellular solute-binding protein [Pseudoruegeria sp. SHC-113]MCT8161730.1 extracellular solute-binding protein [Pseudoruegeria sp. SHC-113]